MRAIGYDAESKTLCIEFNSGNRLEYYNVPQDVYKALDVATSKGRFFTDSIENTYSSGQVKSKV